ncbi:MAG: hypothetical protein JRJ29_12295 [Deltaproteobacteria bacterium]|nr:hypothetical protein [Deltaproteobacteria bacterium]
MSEGGIALWIIDTKQWPRACLRAELMERGFEVIGFPTPARAIAAYHLRIYKQPTLIILDLFELDAEDEEIESISQLGIPVLLLLVVGFFFTNSLLLMIDPAKWISYFGEAGGKLLHLREPTLIPRYMHFLVACVALGGLSVGILGWWRVKNGDPRWEALSRQGLLLFGCATMLQFIVGSWYLGGLPREVLAGIFFKDSLSGYLFEELSKREK